MSSLRTTLTALILCAACSGTTEPDSGGAPAQPQILQALPRPLTVSEQMIVGGANDFSFALFRELSAVQPNDNVLTSPLSASMALGMTMMGAASATYEQMHAVLALHTATDAEVNEGYKSLFPLLRDLDAGVDFRLAHSIWFRAGFPFNQSFLDNGTNYFNAQVSGIDFTSPSAKSAINGWVNSATAAKIPVIVDQVDPTQLMFLISASYFKGSWRDRFDPNETVDAPFHTAGGDNVVRLMHRTSSVSYFSTPDFQAVELPYSKGAYSMTVLLPAAGRSAESVAMSLQGTSWADWVTQFAPRTVDLYLPRFTLTWDRTLNDDLKAIGMVAAFNTNGADFSRLSSRGRELFISGVKQRAFIDVNEDGTSASGGSNPGSSGSAAPADVTVKVDHPFIFVIRERLSRTVVFMGKISNLPTS